MILNSGTVASIALIFLLFCGTTHAYTLEVNGTWSQYEMKAYEGVTKVEQAFIDTLLDWNQGLPRPCRRDICNRGSEFDTRKGLITFIDTPVGNILKILCPFVTDYPAYAERTCTVNEDGDPEWVEKETFFCPQPPFTQLLWDLDYKYWFGDIYNLSLDTRLEILFQIEDTLQFDPMLIVSKDDVTGLLVYVYNVIPPYLHSIRMPGDIAYRMLNILNLMIDLSGGLWLLESSELMRHIRLLPLLQEPPLIGTPNIVSTQNYVQLQYLIIPPAVLILNVDLEFGPWPTVVVHVTADENDEQEEDQVLLYSTTTNQSMVSLEDYLDAKNEEGNYNSVYQNSYVYFYSFTAPRYEEKKWNTFGYLFTLSAHNMTEDIIFIEATNNISNSFEVLCAHRQEWQCYTNFTVSDVECLHSMDGDVWDNTTCFASDTGNGSLTCECTGTGYFATIVYAKDHKYDPTRPEKNTTAVWDLGSFLGFTYRRNLVILGTVLNVTSLCCLCITLLSYVLIRKARKGRTTCILLNLCAALICLCIVFLSTQLIAKTRFGCKVINVARYYFVFVTLLWNTIEAIHMYIMLVKVFPAKHISRFIYKAAIFAWGIPMIMVVISMVVVEEAFDGYFELIETHSEIDGVCSFKCTMQNTLLYYGYLIPVFVIVAHNLIIFALVLRVILTHGKMAANKKKNRAIQLVGIAATLVLLGVPWVFSAFGVLNIKDDSYLGAFTVIPQVIFIVFVNLQGLFIFAFHCARNVQIRESWSSALVSFRSKSQASTKNRQEDKETGKTKDKAAKFGSSNGKEGCKDEVNGKETAVKEDTCKQIQGSTDDTHDKEAVVSKQTQESTNEMVPPCEE